MKSISNIKIGNKIALILGGIVLLLTGLSALSLWGVHKNAEATTAVIQRLTKARLAVGIEAATSAIGQLKARMILQKKATDDLVSKREEIVKERNETLQQFRTLEDTPTGIQQGADMAGLIEAVAPFNERMTAALRNGRMADAVKEFSAGAKITEGLYVKAKEASKFQLDKVAITEKATEDTAAEIRLATIVGSLIAIALAIAGGFVLTRGIATPLVRTVAHLDQIASGDLSKDTPSEMQARGDEIGALARAMQTMTVALRKMIQEVSTGIQVLASSSTEMTASSTQMTTGSRQASDKAHSVSAAAEQMSSNITSVAAGMEQTTTNLSHVASATEQMNSTIGEIAQNSEKARRITGEATRQAARITEQIDQLGIAAREIGKVTETITEISSQTNLLALNATIEAARAGSAGKGFAVVATEIKALAQQTAAATEDIKGRIAGVQAATASGIKEIEKISQVISDVSSIVSSIAAAIEEQSVSTKDIARNIAEASVGMNDANTRVAETSHVSREIAKDIVTVDQAAGEMAHGSDHVRTSAVALHAVAEGLRLTVSRFHS